MISTWVIEVNENSARITRTDQGNAIESYGAMPIAKASVYVAAIIQGFQPPRSLLSCEEVENAFVCSNIGVNGTTPFYFMKHGTEDYEARCGIALLGKTNMTDEQFAACGHNPFHPDFRDNFCVGKGKDELGALADLKEKMIETSDSLFL